MTLYGSVKLGTPNGINHTNHLAKKFRRPDVFDGFKIVMRVLNIVELVEHNHKNVAFQHLIGFLNVNDAWISVQ